MKCASYLYTPPMLAYPWRLLSRTFTAWKADKAPQLAASTAYYTVFSLAPLLIIVISVGGLLFDAQVIQESLLGELRSLIGTQGAEAVGSMLQSAADSPNTPLAAGIGFLILLLGASGLLAALQDAFNTIWKIEANTKVNSVLALLIRRLFSFGMVLSIGFLLLVSLAASALIGYTAEYFASQIDGVTVLLPFASEGLSLVVLSCLFAVFFKYLPDIRIQWRDVFPAAIFTAILFTLGKFLLGYYLGQKDFTSTYGVAGSVILLLLWINYSAQIFFFGGEFTKVLVEERGVTVTPKRYARFIATAHVVERREKPSLWSIGTIAFHIFFTEGRLAWKAWKLWRRWRR